MLRPPSTGLGTNLLSVSAPMKLSGPPKVPLAPGKGLMDWVRLCNDKKDLSGVGGKPRRVTVRDMARHSTQEDCWMIINNKVYNVTPYMSYHPGGADELMRASGRDGTTLFNEIHPWVNDDSMMKACFIGFFTESKSLLPPVTHSDTVASDVSKLSVSDYHTCTIANVTKVTHDTNLYQISVPSNHQTVPIGHHIFLRLSVDGMLISRPYTPVTKTFGLSVVPKKFAENKSIFLMIKIYKDGTLTPTLAKLNTGDSVDISASTGNFDVKVLEKFDNLVLIAAGTGFTPMVGVIEHWISLKHTRKPCTLILFNKTQDDVIWKDRIDTLCKSSKLLCTHVLSNPDEFWMGCKGRVSKQLLLDNIPKQSLDTCFAGVCGPAPFTDLCLKFLQEIGLSKNQVHPFKA